MKRIVRLGTVALILMTICVPGYAATKLGQYTLLVGAEKVALNANTGYLMRSGSVLMFPVKAVCDRLSLSYTESANKNLTIERADGKLVEVRAGYKVARVDGRKMPLRVNVEKQTGAILTADVRLIQYLDVAFKHYTEKVARPAGYPSGALVIAKDASGTALPNIAPSDVLPEAAQEAAKSATQIVTVEHKKGSLGTLSFYQKAAGAWRKQFSTPAHLGKNGIDKVIEGDKRTPTGTFNLTQPFGIQADPGTKLGKYLKVTKYHYWSGASGTKYYNRLVDTRDGYKPTSADEHLIEYKGVYDYCMFIDYNKEGAAKKGSAIFLHCTGKNRYTAGCIAVKRDVMIELHRRLTPGAKIVIY